MPVVNIAIDGPSGAGKSTISKTCAKTLGYIYVDTGALYRCVGLAVKRAGIDKNDEAAVTALLPTITVGFTYADGVQRTLLSGEDVSGKIRTEEISMYASVVSAMPAVRKFLLESQRKIARENNVIMDGRDIGTVVLPNADVKIFLTASPAERARRRCEELKKRGEHAEFSEVERAIIERDKNDSTRAVSPLKKHPNAILLDTTGNELETSINLVLSTIKENLPL